MSCHRIDGPTDLSIGGALYCTLPKGKFTFHDPLNSYDGFLFPNSRSARTESSAESLEFSVTVDTDLSAEQLRGEMLFDADGAWRLLEEPDLKRFVGSGPAGLDDPPWILDIGENGAAVHGNPEIGDGDDSIVFPLMYPVDQLLCVNTLASRGGILVHCAGLEIDGGIYLFAGRSGAGKSTLSECVRENGGVRVLSDDRMIVRLTSEGPMAYGTPWPGDAGYAENRAGALKGIFFIEHGNGSGVAALTDSEAAERLLQVASVPWYDPDARDAVITAVDTAVQQISCLIYEFSPRDEVGDFLRKHISEIN